ncbi:high-affinity branched-chain amino acid ABC transporter permease LivM [Sodalis sp. RH23]|uniref:high-affinity branched-chain amino acid ABC transporter permease LivM n=1 Tax=unclassified Sodalis (in: enterobacteria) TaxID=2636512 RepID=UPI0039B458CF
MSQPTAPQSAGTPPPVAQSPDKPTSAPRSPGSPPPAGLDIRQCLLDAVLAGFIALIVFGPVVGVVLDGYSFNFHAPRLAWIILAVMAGRFALSLFLQTGPGQRFQLRFNGDSGGVYVRPADYKSRLRWIIPLILVLAALFPFVATKYLLTVAILGLIYVLLGLGLNIVVGLAGLLDLGYVAFYAIGAYGLALGYEYLGLGFWSMLPLAAIMAAVAGALLGFPVLRMHGDYLAIVTLGFGEIIRLILNNWLAFTGGPNGVSVPSPTFFGLEFGRRAREGGVPIHEFLNIPYNPNLKFIFIYGVLILVVLLVLYIKHRLTRMPIGRAWEALREDEIACRAMGLNHVLVKLSAFTLGASTAGIAGVFFATYQGFVNPTSFTFFESALILAIVVLGGMGSTIGVVIAAFVLTVAPELLRSFAEYRVLLFGILMVVMMIWRPRGLIRISRAGFAARKGVAP